MPNFYTSAGMCGLLGLLLLLPCQCLLAQKGNYSLLLGNYNGR
jgi:hypothetical protein